jgi:ubiquitin-protein ligase
MPWFPLCPQDPNPEDPLNKEAAAKFQENQRQFESYVQRSIHYGAQIDGEYFPPCAC